MVDHDPIPGRRLRGEEHTGSTTDPREAQRGFDGEQKPVILDWGWSYGVNLFGMRIMLKSPKWPALFSERNRMGVRVLPLGKGWRVTVRRLS